MDTMQYTHLYRSPLGTITLAADSEGLTGLWFEGQKYFAATLDAQHEETMLPIFEQTRRWLDTCADEHMLHDGGAVGHNPVSIIVPCHRVVGSNGSLTGYAGGIERKVRLLALEKADMTGLFAPQKGTAL